MHERMTDEPFTSQKLNPEDTGKLLMGAGVSGIIRVKYRVYGQGCKDRSTPCVCGECGQVFITSPVSSSTRGHTHRRSHVCAGSVRKASVTRHFSSDARGHTQRRSPMFAGSVGKASV